MDQESWIWERLRGSRFSRLAARASKQKRQCATVAMVWQERYGGEVRVSEGSWRGERSILGIRKMRDNEQEIDESEEGCGEVEEKKRGGGGEGRSLSLNSS